MAADYNGARSNPRPTLRDRLAERRPLVLDGATGTELERRGVRLAERRPLGLDGATGTELERRGVRATLPLWSSWGLIEAPDVVRAIHADYLRAGVDLLTAATFRTHARSLAEAGLEARAEALCALAVRLAREAAQQVRPQALVLGSAAPLEDCYHPERVPDDGSLAREHAQHARHLVRAGVDAILVETINTLREGVAAVRAGREAGADVLVSFVCGSAARLLSGEPLAEAIDAVSAFAPLLVGVNCLEPSAAAACVPVLVRAGPPFLVYTNAAAPRDSDPEAFAAHAQRWLEAGAACVGGCCGTGPTQLRALVARLAPMPLPASQ